MKSVFVNPIVDLFFILVKLSSVLLVFQIVNFSNFCVTQSRSESFVSTRVVE